MTYHTIQTIEHHVYSVRSGRRDGLMVSALDSGVSSPGSSSG